MNNLGTRFSNFVGDDSGLFQATLIMDGNITSATRNTSLHLSKILKTMIDSIGKRE